MVAQHCNERRLAARNAQDRSLQLYLCVMLRRHPVLTVGTVSNVGGDRYFQLYLNEFGQEIR
jgi:DIS3-like exonuclease 2